MSSELKAWILAGCGALALGTGAWGVSRMWKGSEHPSGLPKELSANALKTQAAEDPAKLMDTMRETMRREDLTDEQRRQIAANLRDVWQTRIREHVDEYYDASEEEKEEILDRHIDEFQSQMQAWEERRKEWERETENRSEEERERWRRSFAPQTQQERKAQSESGNPDQRARMFSYFGAMQKRAADRGIKLPQWGQGRGRGPGGRGP